MVKLELKDSMNTRLLIAASGKSLRNFSAENGLSHTYLSQILNNKKTPSPTVAHKIASGLGVTVADIFLIKTVDENNQIQQTK